MDQLYRFRKGWENENLAQYLLSRVAFIARPVSVSDDLGTDFQIPPDLVVQFQTIDIVEVI
jgi:hypothetical protein